MRKFIYVDTETTGLDHKKCELTELAYAIEDGPIQTLYFGVTEVPKFIDDLTKFYERGIHRQPKSSQRAFAKFIQDSAGNTMVAANPAHDKAFLSEAGLFNFHYRMLDISSFAMAVLRLEEMPGMSDIFRELQSRGFDIPQPDHSAAGDVASMRAAHNVLMTINEKMRN